MASPVNYVAVVGTCFGVDSVRTRTDGYAASVAVEVVQLIVPELVTVDHRESQRAALQTANRDGLHNLVGMHEDLGQTAEQGI